MATIYTQSGEEIVVDILDGTSTAPLSTATAFIAWGTSASTAAKADTLLDGESTVEARVAATIAQPSADINEWKATMTAESTKTITNAGVFNSTGLNETGLVVKGDFAGIALASTGDKIEFTVSLEQT